MYALFKNDKQISKAHSTKEAVIVEAYERGRVLYGRGARWLNGNIERAHENGKSCARSNYVHKNSALKNSEN